MGSSTPDPVERLELHLTREFVQSYIRGKRAISPNALYMAARFSGLRISIKTLERVLGELTK